MQVELSDEEYRRQCRESERHNSDLRDILSMTSGVKSLVIGDDAKKDRFINSIMYRIPAFMKGRFVETINFENFFPQHKIVIKVDGSVFDVEIDEYDDLFAPITRDDKLYEFFDSVVDKFCSAIATSIKECEMNYPDGFNDSVLDAGIDKAERNQVSEEFDNLDATEIYAHIEVALDEIGDAMDKNLAAELPCYEKNNDFKNMISKITGEAQQAIFDLDEVKKILQETSKKIAKAGQEIAVRISNGEYDDDYTY